MATTMQIIAAIIALLFFIIFPRFLQKRNLFFHFKITIIYYNDNKVTNIVPVWYDFHNTGLEENFEFDFNKFVESYKNL